MRPPWLVHRFGESAATLLQRPKIRGRSRRFGLRELRRGKLPETVLNRKKSGLDIPTHDWFRGVLRGLLLDTVTGRQLMHVTFGSVLTSPRFKPELLGCLVTHAALHRYLLDVHFVKHLSLLNDGSHINIMKHPNLSPQALSETLDPDHVPTNPFSKPHL